MKENLRKASLRKWLPSFGSLAAKWAAIRSPKRAQKLADAVREERAQAAEVRVTDLDDPISALGHGRWMRKRLGLECSC
jgi:hypothetical protein